MANATTSRVAWFDIPVKQFGRAIRFYGAVLDAAIETRSFPGVEMAFIPGERGPIGCLYLHVPDDRDPALLASAEMLAPALPWGPQIYLDCGDRLHAAVAAVDVHGGRILQPIQQMGDFGFRAPVLDSESNRIVLYAAGLGDGSASHR